MKKPNSAPEAQLLSWKFLLRLVKVNYEKNVGKMSLKTPFSAPPRVKPKLRLLCAMQMMKTQIVHSAVSVLKHWTQPEKMKCLNQNMNNECHKPNKIKNSKHY